MFPSAEYFLTGELAYRRERIADDFARVGRSHGRQLKRRRRQVRHATIQRLRNTVAIRQ